MLKTRKYESYQGYGKDEASNKNKRIADDVNLTLCGDLNFAASEAYKLLRTNLMFTFADDNKTHVIGITSSSRGEGKSTTSINLAYTIAQAGKSVLLIDGDMRLPSLSRKLNMRRSPGLSNFLAAACNLNTVVYDTKVSRNMYLLPAGDIPPNPSELLSSKRMKQMLDALKGACDFIIIDLPPVNIVSDALVISNIVDGLCLVVRENYTIQHDLKEAIAHVKFANTKILGLILTDVETAEKGYRSKYKYKYKYGKYKYYKYGKHGKYSKYGAYRNYSYGDDYEYANAKQLNKELDQAEGANDADGLPLTHTSKD